MNRSRQNKVRSYFEITEDPPQALPALRRTNRTFNSVKLPSNSGFFFIDFADECQLRLLKKRNGEEFGQPLQMERFGKNVIINVEDASALDGQLVKYEEQHRNIKQKKMAIEDKLKQTLDRNKGRFRAKSELAKKQTLIDDYASPIKLPHKETIESTLPSIDQKSPKKVDLALKRLGLVRE